MYGAIVMGSATYAMRGQRLLEKQGIWGGIQRVPRNSSIKGCGYLIKVKTQQLEAAKTVLKNGGLPVRQVLQEWEG